MDASTTSRQLARQPEGARADARRSGELAEGDLAVVGKGQRGEGRGRHLVGVVDGGEQLGGAHRGGEALAVERVLTAGLHPAEIAEASAVADDGAGGGRGDGSGIAAVGADRHAARSATEPRRPSAALTSS